MKKAFGKQKRTHKILLNDIKILCKIETNVYYKIVNYKNLPEQYQF